MSQPGELVDPAGPRTRAVDTLDSWSKPRALGEDHESHVASGEPAANSGTAGRPRGPYEEGPSYPEQRVDTGGARIWA